MSNTDKPKRGRPPIGPQLTVRMRRKLRVRIEQIQRDEPLAETVRRILDYAAPPDIDIMHDDLSGKGYAASCNTCDATDMRGLSGWTSLNAALEFANQHAHGSHAPAMEVARHVSGPGYVPYTVINASDLRELLDQRNQLADDGADIDGNTDHVDTGGAV